MIIIDDDFLYSHIKDAENLMMATIPNETELKHKFSKRFLHKMKKLLKYERRTPMMRKVVHYTKVVAAIFLIFISIAFTTTMSVEAYRVRFFEFMTTVWEEFTSIIVGSEDNVDNDVLKPMEPTYIPAGYEIIDKMSDDYEQTIIYANTDGKEIIFTQKLLSQGEHIIDTEDIEAKHMSIGNQHLLVVYNKGIMQLFWVDSFSSFSLIGANETELINMAKILLE